MADLVQNSQSASNYLVRVNELSARAEAAGNEPQVQTQEQSALSTWVASHMDVLPYVVSGVLFVCVFAVLVAGKIRSAKYILVSLTMALFAAVIPQILTYVQVGGGQVTHAGPREQPTQIEVIATDDLRVLVRWTTQEPTVGAVRYSVLPFDVENARVGIADNQQRVTQHSVIISNLVKGRRYGIEILSDGTWYNNKGMAIGFSAP